MNKGKLGPRVWPMHGVLYAALVCTLIASSAFAHQSWEWGECECGATTTYSLTVETGEQGTASPPSGTYKKGEAVTVRFTPNEDRVFRSWICSPASHTASFSDSVVTNVFITEDTTLTAFTVAKHCTLAVNWDDTRGQVSVPGGQGGSGSASATVDYGQTISLTATPNSGYYTVWQGASGDGSGERYGNSVNVRITGNRSLTASFRPNAGYPSTMNSVTVATNGGSAYVSTAGATSASSTAGSYPYSSAQGPSRFSFSALAQTGYYFSYFTWSQGGQTRYTTNDVFTYYYGNTYTAELVKAVKLNIEVEGQGVVTSPNFRYSWNPKPYVPKGLTNPPATSITPNTSANQVTMTPSACPGWSFNHWEYKNANGDWIVTSGNPFQNNALTVYMNWWTGTGIHVPDGEDWLDVKAVFGETGYHDVSMPFRYKTSESGLTVTGSLKFSHSGYTPGAYYCCRNHLDPDGNEYVHAHLPHGYPFEDTRYGVTVTQEMSDWAWDAYYANQTRQTSSTFERNCYAYVCDAPTVMFSDAWENNFTLPSSLSEGTTNALSFGDSNHVVKIVSIYNRGTEQNPDYTISNSMEKNASGGVYAGSWLPLGLDPSGSVRKLK